MTWALATGAGKDATLALHRARAEGLDVTHAFSIYEGNSGVVRFHGTPPELVGAHCGALGLELLVAHTHPRDFDAVLAELLDELRARGVSGVVFGNIHLADVRAWYEERTTGHGLRHHEPLWGEEPAALVRDFVALGFRATVTGVNLERGVRAWVGREVTREWIAEVEAHGADPCGEFGEYHTFVHGGPGFRAPVAFDRGAPIEMEGHAVLSFGR
jgi:diphthine-ammonia ligase